MNVNSLQLRVARRFSLVLSAGLAVAACSGGSAGSNEPPVDNSSILGTNAATYAESSEVANNTGTGSEITGYTLDADGLRITGAFEATGPTQDHFRFNTGTFTRIDVQAFVDGVKQNEQNYRVTLSLDSYLDDGYSTLYGNGYFINAWMSSPPNKAYVLGITPDAAAGASYVIELKAH